MHEDQAGVSRVSNLVRSTVEDGTNEHNVTAVREIPSLAVIMANEQIPAGDSPQDPLADLPILSRPIYSFDAANSMNRNEGVALSLQTCGSGNDEQIQSALTKVLQRDQISSVQNQSVSASYSVFNSPSIQDNIKTETMNEHCVLVIYGLIDDNNTCI